MLTEIKNSGELKNIENDSIRTRLITLNPLIKSVKFQENATNTLQRAIVQLISLNGDVRMILESVGYNNHLGIGNAKVISKGNKSLLNDDYFKNKMISDLTISLNLTDQLYPSIRKQFTDLVNKIDVEIDDMK